MIAVVDYGVGNLFSLCCSLERIGADAKVTSNPDEIRSAEKIILPGVGAFADAAKKLRDSGLDKVILEQAAAGKEIMGICLGMQLLFEKSYEFGVHAGLGFLKGEICPLAEDLPAGFKVPQMGWNRLMAVRENEPLLRYAGEKPYVYYVHSFYAKGCEDSLSAVSEYGGLAVPGLVHKNNVFGAQFHPEKSGEAGLSMLRAFAEVTA